MTTDKDLVKELEARNIAGRYDALIAQAKEGMYHDFKTEVATPKLLLWQVLAKYPELADIREAVKNGNYDEGIND